MISGVVDALVAAARKRPRVDSNIANGFANAALGLESLVPSIGASYPADDVDVDALGDPRDGPSALVHGPLGEAGPD